MSEIYSFCPSTQVSSALDAQDRIKELLSGFGHFAIRRPLESQLKQHILVKPDDDSYKGSTMLTKPKATSKGWRSARHKETYVISEPSTPMRNGGKSRGAYDLTGVPNELKVRPAGGSRETTGAQTSLTKLPELFEFTFVTSERDQWVTVMQGEKQQYPEFLEECEAFLIERGRRAPLMGAPSETTRRSEYKECERVLTEEEREGGDVTPNPNYYASPSYSSHQAPKTLEDYLGIWGI